MGRISGLGTVKAVIRILTAALLVFVIFAALHFRTQSIEVMGSSHYSEEEIIEMTLKGPASYNTLLAPVLLGRESPEGIPYVEGIRVSRVDAHSLRITVREHTAIGCFAYLDSYIYFDRNGSMVEGSRERDTSLPCFSGIKAERVELNSRLDIGSNAILDSAVILASVFQKAGHLPDDIRYDENLRAVLQYGDIEVILGNETFLEDKVLRILAILPELEGKKGTLHAESVTEKNKRITFDQIFTYEDWLGGYESDGTYNGEGQYDAQGNFVGPAPKGILIPSIFSVTGEGSDEPFIGGQVRTPAEDEKKEEKPAQDSQESRTGQETGTQDTAGNSTSSGNGNSASTESTDASNASPDYSAVLDPDGDGINDYTGELMTETNLQDISYLDEDGDGLNDFTLQPLDLAGLSSPSGTPGGASPGGGTDSSLQEGYNQGNGDENSGNGYDSSSSGNYSQGNGDGDSGNGYDSSYSGSYSQGNGDGDSGNGYDNSYGGSYDQENGDDNSGSGYDSSYGGGYDQENGDESSGSRYDSTYDEDDNSAYTDYGQDDYLEEDEW